MKPILIYLSPLLFLLMGVAPLSAQKCKYGHLSREFIFKVRLTRTPIASDSSTRNEVVVDIFPREGFDHQQTLKFTAGYLFEPVFKSCDFARSYTTLRNIDAVAADNDYGDLIVADFNFDGKDDFAVKYDSGGNGGPLYYYYIQDRYGHFERDRFLSATMQFFPTEISKPHKTLTTLVHANAIQHSENIYRYSARTKTWKRISFKLLDAQ